MVNILSDAKKQQVIALGQLGWTLRRIEAATGVRRETAGAYLKAAGIAAPLFRLADVPDGLTSYRLVGYPDGDIVNEYGNR